MNRNSETVFDGARIEGIQRSTFDLTQNIKTTFNTGDLIPFYLEQDVLPADTTKIDLTIVARMLTPIQPTMDNMYLDTWFFFIPNRILWEHWKDFMGENRQGAWEQETTYLVPQFNSPASTGWSKGTIADYMGIPINKTGLKVNALPFRAYIKTYNEWFRNQNLIAPLLEQYDDADQNGNNTSPVYGGLPCKVMKFRDYFTSCLPEPQKGAPILLPIGESAPVKLVDGLVNPTTGQYTYGTGAGQRQLAHRDIIYDRVIEYNLSTKSTGTNVYTGSLATSDSPDDKIIINPNGTLYADLAMATAASINAIREAFQLQKMLERDARSGTRYTEILKSYFGVSSPDSRQQRPEYLGGKRVPIDITQVLQTSATDTTSPQGNTAAYSLTVEGDELFTKSFTEHGIILGLLAVRQEHTYQQGLERSWSRRRKLDYYWPTLAHLGEQAVLNKEIYAQGNATDEQTFGFQERWGEYKYKPNRTSAAMRSTYATAIDQWHYGDEYNSLPVLSKEFAEETDIFVARTLAITNEDQFLADIMVRNICTRAMPIYGTPGMVDHF